MVEQTKDDNYIHGFKRGEKWKGKRAAKSQDILKASLANYIRDQALGTWCVVQGPAHWVGSFPLWVLLCWVTLTFSRKVTQGCSSSLPASFIYVDIEGRQPLISYYLCIPSFLPNRDILTVLEREEGRRAEGERGRQTDINLRNIDWLPPRNVPQPGTEPFGPQDTTTNHANWPKLHTVTLGPSVSTTINFSRSLWVSCICQEIHSIR